MQLISAFTTLVTAVVSSTTSICGNHQHPNCWKEIIHFREIKRLLSVPY